MKRFVYYIQFRLYGQDVQGVGVVARNKAEAYDKAVYEIIPAKCGEMPYSAWVHSVIYSNGKYKRFNTCEGLPY